MPGCSPDSFVDRLRGRELIDTSAGRPLRLLFDQETGLLARVHDELPTALGPVAQETDFEEYRRVDGALVPHLIRWARPDYLVTFRVRDVVQTAGDR